MTLPGQSATEKDRRVLLHAREAAGWVLEYAEEGKEVFQADRKTQDAVIRNLEILGEAVKQISDRVKVANPDLPWRQIAGLRDKLIHEYFGVNLELVWEVAAVELPRLVRRFDEILLQLEQESR